MPASVVDLGKKVKEKFPGAYDNVPDDVLGRQVKSKFPGAYDQFTDTVQDLSAFTPQNAPGPAKPPLPAELQRPPDATPRTGPRLKGTTHTPTMMKPLEPVGESMTQNMATAIDPDASPAMRVSGMLRTLGTAASPAVLPALMVNPVGTLTGMGIGTGVQQGSELVGRGVGLPGTGRLVGDVAGGWLGSRLAPVRVSPPKLPFSVADIKANPELQEALVDFIPVYGKKINRVRSIVDKIHGAAQPTPAKPTAAPPLRFSMTPPPTPEPTPAPPLRYSMTPPPEPAPPKPTPAPALRFSMTPPPELTPPTAAPPPVRWPTAAPEPPAPKSTAPPPVRWQQPPPEPPAPKSMPPPAQRGSNTGRPPEPPKRTAAPPPIKWNKPAAASPEEEAIASWPHGKPTQAAIEAEIAARTGGNPPPAQMTPPPPVTAKYQTTPGEGNPFDMPVEPGKVPSKRDYETQARNVWASHLHTRLKATGKTVADLEKMGSGMSSYLDTEAKDIGLKPSSPGKIEALLKRMRGE